MDYRGETLYAWGLHGNSLVDEPLTADHWLSAEDGNQHAHVIIVVGSAAARTWHLHPGSTVDGALYG
jgi:hypothetical protein